MIALSRSWQWTGTHTYRIRSLFRVFSSHIDILVWIICTNIPEHRSTSHIHKKNNNPFISQHISAISLHTHATNQKQVHINICCVCVWCSLQHARMIFAHSCWHRPLIVLSIWYLPFMDSHRFLGWAHRKEREGMRQYEYILYAMIASMNSVFRWRSKGTIHKFVFNFC